MKFCNLSCVIFSRISFRKRAQAYATMPRNCAQNFLPEPGDSSLIRGVSKCSRLSHHGVVKQGGNNHIQEDKSQWIVPRGYFQHLQHLCHSKSSSGGLMPKAARAKDAYAYYQMHNSRRGVTHILLSACQGLTPAVRTQHRF